MTLPLSEHLPLIASAPGGIQKLRGLILELAVRGKLVPQDPNDEPASELLKRIKQERTQLEAEGVCKKSKATLVDECNWPFELPTGWKWCSFPDVANYKMGKTPPTKESVYWAEGGIPWVSISDMDHGQRIVTTSRTVSNAACAKVFRSDPVPAGTLLMSFKLTVGKVSTLGIDAFHNEAIISIFPFKGISQEYLSHFLPMIAQGGNSKSALMGDTLNSESLALLCIPLPPTAEQHRIVTKVDELMALCDRLESEQNDSAAAHTQLVETLLGTLTESTDAADFEANWKRIAAHFDTLFTTDASIDRLQKTILQLAVTGKLVPQDPLEEDANTLLKQIDCQKERLSEEQGLKTSATAQISLDEHYINLPKSWNFQRLGNLAKFIDYRGKTPNKINAGVPLITAKNVRFGFISRDPYEFISEKEYVDWMTRGFPRLGDVLFTTEAPLGNVALVDIEDKFALAQRVICFQFHEPLIAPFMRLALMAEQVVQRVKKEASGMTATGIKASRLKEIPIPIPPLAEQHRIVAKVDELMAVCEQLKASIKAATAAQSTLSAALIQQALEAA